MIFRTELSISPSNYHIQHTDEIITVGSCFSQHIGHRLQKYKFKCISNPFGTVFNPVSISRVIQMACTNEKVQSASLAKTHGIWVHPDFHSTLSHWDQKIAVKNINDTISSIHIAIKSAKYLFITLGTSWAYRQKSNDQIVANCHKMEASSFLKVNIDIEEGYKALFTSFQTLMKINPEISIILTISPVRHIKDGIVENSISKARLHGMAEKLMSYFDNISYFPAYEWMIDDLRDYRFYDADMIHPNEVAVDYIWNKFADHYFCADVKLLNKKIEVIALALQHRPSQPTSPEHLTFCKKQLENINELIQKHPHLDFNEERRMFSIT